MKKTYVWIIAAMVLSLFIYVFYRTEKTLVNELALKFISPESFLSVRRFIADLLPLSKPVIYSLPEGLWVFCITLTSRRFYIRLNNYHFSCIFFPLVFCIGLEIFQLIGWTNGRFDFLDILVSLGFWALANHFFNSEEDKQSIVSPFDFQRMIFFASYGIVYLAHVSN